MGTKENIDLLVKENAMGALSDFGVRRKLRKDQIDFIKVALAMAFGRPLQYACIPKDKLYYSCDSCRNDCKTDPLNPHCNEWQPKWKDEKKNAHLNFHDYVYRVKK